MNGDGARNLQGLEEAICFLGYSTVSFPIPITSYKTELNIGCYIKFKVCLTTANRQHAEKLSFEAKSDSKHALCPSVISVTQPRLKQCCATMYSQLTKQYCKSNYLPANRRRGNSLKSFAETLQDSE